MISARPGPAGGCGVIPRGNGPARSRGANRLFPIRLAGTSDPTQGRGAIVMRAFSPRSARLLTRLCFGSMMSLSIAINLLPVFLTTLARLYGGPPGLDHEQLGRLGAAAFSGLTLGILVTGPLADRFGAKPFALLGNGVIAVSLLGCAFAPAYGPLGVALFALGLGAGTLDMVLSPIVAALEPDNRAVALNRLHSFYCVGAAATILVGLVALRTPLSWRGACLVLVVLQTLMAAGFSLLPFPPMVQAGRVRAPLRGLVRQRWFVAALFAIFFAGATEAAMAQWLPAFAERELGFSATAASAALLLFSLAMAFGRVVIGAIDRRWPPLTIMAWGSALSVLLFVAAGFLPSPVATLVSCIAAGFTGSGLWPTTLAVTSDRYPDGGASMFGLLAALGNAGGIFMPWLVGWIADRETLRIGLALSSVAPLMMFGLLLAMRSAKVGPTSSVP